MRGKHPNNKNIAPLGLFSCKSLSEFNNFHARCRVVQNLDFIFLAFTHAPFGLLLTYAPKYTRATRALIVSVFSKSASQVFTSQTMSWIQLAVLPLVSLLRISSQRFVWFAMLKRKVRNLRRNTCQLESRITQTLQNANLHMVGCPRRKIFFALLKVSGNRQSFACFTLPSAKNQRRFDKESRCKLIQLSVLKL